MSLLISIMKVKEKPKGRGIVNRLIDSLPIELHLPGGYQFCGPGTHFEERQSLGQRGLNSLDKLCYQHDHAYHNTKDDKQRYDADKKLEWGAWDLTRNKQLPLSERAASWLVMNAMKLKTRRKPSKGSSLKFRGNGKKKNVNSRKTRTKHIPRIQGGFLPALLAALPFLSAVGTLVGGGAAVAKTVIDAKRSQEDLNETRRHNKKMEEEARKNGRGLYYTPYKARQTNGKGLYIRPYKQTGKGIRINIGSKN